MLATALAPIFNQESILEALLECTHESPEIYTVFCDRVEIFEHDRLAPFLAQSDTVNVTGAVELKLPYIEFYNRGNPG